MSHTISQKLLLSLIVLALVALFIASVIAYGFTHLQFMHVITHVLPGSHSAQVADGLIPGPHYP